MSDGSLSISDEEWENILKNLSEQEDLGSFLDRIAKPIKCECGADAVYGKDNKLHTDYCPKYRQ